MFARSARVSRALPRLVVSRSASSNAVEVQITNPFQSHLLDSLPPRTTTTTREEALQYFKEMTVMRRLEIECDKLYKAKLIRGFCHLYDGQEACCVGMEAGLIPGDSLITAYRDHCQMYKRGGTVEGIVAELLGRVTGHSRGKGGSMHLYSSKHDFYGGNGIVGAQCPIGAGIALKHQYRQDGHVCVTLFGDGAANQGQLFEALNMAYLWKLPLIYCCENNRYGMGTSNERAASVTEYYTRGQVVPGLLIDGQDVYAVREGFKFAAEHCRTGKGPIYLELDTYRFHGHSMSDPGTSYRNREEVDEVRAKRDPIKRLLRRIEEHSLATESEIKEIEAELRDKVTAEISRAIAAPQPNDTELSEHVYWKNELPIRLSDGSWTQAQA